MIIDCVKEAFANEVMSDGSEHFLVERLLHSPEFNPELSIVVIHNKEIIGFILFSTIEIVSKKVENNWLAMAPIAIRPEYQNKGIGGKLMIEGQNRARKMKYHGIVIVGHEKYYPKFGYELASFYRLKFPFEAPDENCFIYFLDENSKYEINGMVKYPEAFGI
jgi:predicted N-acetyltransferase YhbS